jgi:acetyl esterase/lipase
MIDPELLPALDMFSSEPMTQENLPELRESMKEMMVAASPEEDDDVDREEVFIDSLFGDHPIRVLMYRSREMVSGAPALLDIHGGGYVLGIPEMDDQQNRRLAILMTGLVVSVDYRLAPENPHPGPIEDCYSAQKWLFDKAPALGISTDRIGIIGASGGGGLAASLALMARDKGEVKLACQLLLIPMIDDRTVIRGLEDPHPHAGHYIWTHANNAFGWRCLLDAEPGSQGISAYAAAARADDLSGLPATFISAGALDLLAEEDIEYGRRLMRAGVHTELHVYPGAHHGFAMVPEARVARMHQRDLENALCRMLDIDIA